MQCLGILEAILYHTFHPLESDETITDFQVVPNLWLKAQKKVQLF